MPKLVQAYLDYKQRDRGGGTCELPGDLPASDCVDSFTITVIDMFCAYLTFYMPLTYTLQIARGKHLRLVKCIQMRPWSVTAILECLRFNQVLPSHFEHWNPIVKLTEPVLVSQLRRSVRPCATFTMYVLCVKFGHIVD